MPNYADMSKEDLAEEARKREIEGRSTMTKDELIAALDGHTATPDVPVSDGAPDSERDGFA